MTDCVAAMVVRGYPKDEDVFACVMALAEIELAPFW